MILAPLVALHFLAGEAFPTHHRTYCRFLFDYHFNFSFFCSLGERSNLSLVSDNSVGAMEIKTARKTYLRTSSHLHSFSY